jgi:Sec7-like guanine-nucleotide exchange factor
MEKFAGVYYQHNETFFENQDQAYVLSVSIILLNQMAHNNKVSKSLKMTKDQFAKQSLMVASNYPTALLHEAYDRIHEC